jgi:SNF2 family DNA or RNA helicase
MSVTVHAELTADGGRIVLMAVGPVEDMAYLGKLLQTTTPAYKQSQPKGALLCPATWPAVVQLGAILGDAFAPGPRLQRWILDQVATRSTTSCNELTVPVPDGLTPRPYQVAGAQLIAATGRMLIFDEPRTGKTPTTVLGLAELAHRGTGVAPILVVCPASVVDPWVEHFASWTPQWRAVAWRGSPKRRRALAGTADVYVTSYDTARMDAKDTNPSRSPLIALDPRALVVDELHYCKNPHAARSQAVRRLARNTRAFVALSGTPITHHPADLWPTLVCLAPGAYPSRERWVSRYCLTLDGDYGQTILGLSPATEPEFRLSLLGQQRRIARADVLDQLPPKVYSIRTVELPSEYRKAYDAMENDMLAELPDGGEISVMGVLAQLTRLSQLASAAADVKVTVEDLADGTQREHVEVTLTAPSWKVDALLEVLEERPGEKVVVFAPSKQLIRLAGNAAGSKGHRVGYIVGGQPMSERTATIREFQTGELNLICATTGAGGTGITLSAAGTLVFLQRPWSLVESLQAEDRAEGDPTQTRGTEVIDIVAANTIDTRVRAVLRERAGQLADLVQDPRIVAELLGGATVTRLQQKGHAA